VASDDETKRELVAEHVDPAPLSRERQRPDLTKEEEPPVVARMVIEIRSDGTRTIARGAAEDASTGEKVAIEVAGSTPLQLALSLMKTMATVPALARSAMKALKR
jgi:hypothetical protein